MAIVRSLAIGKARNSAGNLTYQTVKGRTIVREKPAFVSNPNTPAQRAQRTKMSVVVRAWRAWYAALALYFTAIKGYGSAYNEFVSRNIHVSEMEFFDSVTGALMMGHGITVATGKYGVNALDYEYNPGSINVAVRDFQLKTDMLPGERIIVVSKSENDNLPIITQKVLTANDIELLQEDSSITISIPSTGDSVSVAVFYYSSARAFASTGVTVTY